MFDVETWSESWSEICSLSRAHAYGCRTCTGKGPERSGKGPERVKLTHGKHAWYQGQVSVLITPKKYFFDWRQIKLWDLLHIYTHVKVCFHKKMIRQLPAIFEMRKPFPDPFQGQNGHIFRKCWCFPAERVLWTIAISTLSGVQATSGVARTRL